MNPIQTNFGTLVETELIGSNLSLKNQSIWLEGVKFTVQLFSNVKYPIPREFHTKTFRLMLEDIEVISNILERKP